MPARRRRIILIAAAAAVVVALIVVVAVGVFRGNSAGTFGKPLDVNPDSAVAQALVNDARVSTAAQRAALRKIQTEPEATWITQSAAVARRTVHTAVTGAAKRGTIAQLVLYHLPNRDCGSYSSAGAAGNAADYRAWIAQVVAGLGNARAIVVLEPDALAQMDCLDAAAQAERIALMKGAVAALAAQGSWLYVDAGHSHWITASVIASRLRAVDVARATGFSLNVSNYQSTADEIEYGRDLAKRLGGDPHFVIDTSRNGGHVAAGDWCNPSGSRLGVAPTQTTSVADVDAYLWIKTPGASDGTCNGGQPAGTVWPDAAIALLR